MGVSSGHAKGDDPQRRGFDDEQMSRHRRRLGAAVVLFAMPWVGLVLYSLQAALPTNPLVLPGQRTLGRYARQLLPEGWAFFTRDPKGADILIFRRGAGGQWEPAQIGSYAQPRFAFGWSRRPRAQGLELALIVANTTEEDWQPCTTITDCLAASPAAAISIPNRSPVPTLCGQMALISAKPVPWAWARHVGDHHRPESVVFLSVRC